MAPPVIDALRAVGLTAAPAAGRPDASADRLIDVPSAFEGKEIGIFPHWKVPVIKSSRYVVCHDLARAYAWGQALFGAGSFLIYEGPTDGPPRRFTVLAVSEPLHDADLKLGGDVWDRLIADLTFQELAEPTIAGVAVRPVREWYHWVLAPFDRRGKQFVLRGFFTVEGNLIAIGFVARRYYEELALTWPPKLPTERARQFIFKEIDGLLGDKPVADLDSDVRKQAADKLAELDTHAFELLPTGAKRGRYLEVLLAAGLDDVRRRAVLELIKSVPAGQRDELNAMLKAIRPDYEELFDELDGDVWELLAVVGERFGREEPFLDHLLRIVDQVFGVPLEGLVELRGPDDPPVVRIQGLRGLETTIQELFKKIRDILKGIWMLVSAPDKLIEGVSQLMKLGILTALALNDPPYKPALEYLEQLVKAYGERVKNIYRGAEILGVVGEMSYRIFLGIVFEVAIWLATGGAGAALLLRRLGLTEEAVSSARLLNVLAKFKELVPDAALVEKLQHVARLIGGSAELGEVGAARAVRLLNHLPDEDLRALATALAKIDTATARSVEKLEDLAHLSEEVATAAARAQARMAALATLENTAKGALSANLVAGFHHLVAQPGMTDALLRKVMMLLYGRDPELFMLAVRRLPAVAFTRRPNEASRLRLLAGLAQHPNAARFLATQGWEPFRVLLARSRRSFLVLDQNLEALDLLAAEVPAANRAREYAALLAKLATDDDEAFRRLAQFRDKLRRLRGERTWQVKLEAAEQILGQFAADAEGAQRSIVVLRKLASQMDPSSRGSLFEQWLRRYVFKKPSQQRRLVIERKFNLHLESELEESARITDFTDEFPPGSNRRVLWDGKCYGPATEIDPDQAYDYAKMVEAGHVFRTEAGQAVRQDVDAVAYIFSDLEAAKANAATVRVTAGAEVWYIDDTGTLVFLE
jgi:hypothetical protein